MANYLGKYLNKGYKESPGKRGYWYAYEWVHRKWRAFSKEMFKFKVSVTPIEFELIHSLQDKAQRLEYMNWRMIEACLGAIRAGRIEGDEVKLKLYK